jgi:hypothetical protein
MNITGEIGSYEELLLIDPMNVETSKRAIIDKLHHFYFEDWRPNLTQYNSSQKEFKIVRAV